jgi:dTDP-4-amino-4,6-dideoxygalactose transaminase
MSIEKSNMKKNPQFIDLATPHAAMGKEMAVRFAALAKRGDFILGQDVKLLEEEFAAYCGVTYAVGVNSGTDALFLSLMALGIGPGDEVIVPAFTFIATANAVSYCGATPVFCDIDPVNFCLDVKSAAKAVTKKTKAIIPVHLFGQCCDMDRVGELARSRGMKVVEDACQSHGAEYKGAKAGSIGDTGCFSFYPTKNLGGWGDGGMVMTSNKPIFRKLVMLRDCGRKSRYEHAIVGYNSRLDSLQAAVLRLKLKRLDSWNRLRQRFAGRYTTLLSGLREVVCPHAGPDTTHVFHVYALKAQRRDQLAEFLEKQGIRTMVHYPIPLHLQPAYNGLGYRKGDFPIAERTCKEIISLPMHPFLTDQQIRRVCANIRGFYKR